MQQRLRIRRSEMERIASGFCDSDAVVIVTMGNAFSVGIAWGDGTYTVAPLSGPREMRALAAQLDHLAAELYRRSEGPSLVDADVWAEQ